ncbi:MAG TPA: anaerobic ribonucleoside-triphosphate reductase activating protein [bacterium]|nr:anaerobic ribonucleoside-triphosphate reductase activating protein [bacterium]HPN42862.1 anaerobic ribonucleoside-triphosphate reductase activating protein [bacterium]
MKIAGVQKFSLIDYPGKLSAVVFTQGCNFRCPFCHNPELVLPEQYGALVATDSLFQLFAKRRRQLDGIVITGGEPTLQEDLVDFIRDIKKMDYLVKLDTNGSRPLVLNELLRENLVDYIAMDIKAPLAKYPAVCGVEARLDDIRNSIEIIKNSGVSFMFRTTVVKRFLNIHDLLEIQNLAGNQGHYQLQNFSLAAKVLDNNLRDASQYTDVEIQNFQKYLANPDLIPL